jgi:hypothetical protein
MENDTRLTVREMAEEGAILIEDFGNAAGVS